MKKILKIVSAIGLILIGIVGLIMPIMPGWVFIIPGLVILGEYFPPARRLLEWARRKLEDNDIDWFKKTPSAKMEDRS